MFHTCPTIVQHSNRAELRKDTTGHMSRLQVRSKGHASLLLKNSSPPSRANVTCSFVRGISIATRINISLSLCMYVTIVRGSRFGAERGRLFGGRGVRATYFNLIHTLKMLSEERPRNTSLAVGQKIGEREILFLKIGGPRGTPACAWNARV